MSDTPQQVISITRPSVGATVPPPQKAESKFPTEVISLPSKGWFYPPESPLASGQLELKMMTAKEEDILTSKNLINKNIVLDKLLESVVIDKTIKLDDMLIGDRNAAFFALRRLAYGDMYEATLTCGRCGKDNSLSIDLSKTDNKPFDETQFPRGENNFTFKLPHTGITVTYKMLTKKDENAIEAQLKGLEKVSKDLSREVTTRLSYIITSVEGDSSKARIVKFINDELQARDSLALRRQIRDTMPDIDTTFDFVCSHCGLERKEETPMGVSFFWPNG
jgi:transcription elongation factor Elf1